MYVNKKSTKWSLGLTVYVCANNQHVMVCVALLSLAVLAAWSFQLACSAIWSILHEAASRGPSALADILVTDGYFICKL